MCLLIETIRVEGSELQNIAYHNERFNRSRQDIFGIQQGISLEDMIILPAGLSQGKTKCRVVYSREIKSITFSPYKLKKVKTLQIVEGDFIDYAYKFHDRQPLEKLKSAIRADDILIVKNGFITDTSYANIVFWDGMKWITPSSPLLCGTMRSKLLREGKIHCGEIMKSDLSWFKSARIINAMITLDESPTIAIKHIFGS
jgi:4-amino-4-deoxychorismate lyase